MNADELREFLSTLPEQFRALPETTRTRLAELQRETEELLAQAGDTYSSLAGRGKRVVDDRVRDVKGTARKARESAEENLDEAAEAVQPLVDQAQEAVTEVRRNVTGRSARDAPTTTPATDDVTPESATRAARAAAAAAGTGTTTAATASATPDGRAGRGQPGPGPRPGAGGRGEEGRGREGGGRDGRHRARGLIPTRPEGQGSRPVPAARVTTCPPTGPVP